MAGRARKNKKFKLPKSFRDLGAPKRGQAWERSAAHLRGMSKTKLVAMGKHGGPVGRAAIDELDRRGRDPEGKKRGLYARKNAGRRSAIDSYAIMDDDYNVYSSPGKTRYANWLSYPEYSYEQFYRENPAAPAKRNPGLIYVFNDLDHDDLVDLVAQGGQNAQGARQELKRRGWQELQRQGWSMKELKRRGWTKELIDEAFEQAYGGQAKKNPRKDSLATVKAKRAEASREHRTFARIAGELTAWERKEKKRLSAKIDRYDKKIAGMAKSNRGKTKTGLKKVSDKWRMTPRKKAVGISAVGRYNEWPIGDKEHARLALVYAMSPSHARKRRQVLRSVASHWPQYNWAAWWNAKKKGKKGLKAWSTYMGAKAKRNFWSGKKAALAFPPIRILTEQGNFIYVESLEDLRDATAQVGDDLTSSYRLAGHEWGVPVFRVPVRVDRTSGATLGAWLTKKGWAVARKNFWRSTKKAPSTATITVHYELWEHGLPTRGVKSVKSLAALRSWYQGSLGHPRVQGLRIKSVSGASMSEVASALGVRQSALNNPPVVMYYWGDDPATTNLFITDNHPNFKKVFKKLKRAHGKPSFLYVSRENPRKKGKGRRRVAVLMPVPTRIKKTPRSAAEWLYVYPKQEKFPIGDLFHARLAMIYVMSRTNAKARNDVFGAVVKEYPRYDWAMYWEEKTQERKAKKTKAKRKKSRRAAANPKKKPNYGLKLGKAYYDQLPTNAGPYLPDIFPYGQGGRPATYHRK